MATLRRKNVAASLIAETMRSTLRPKGMDKILAVSLTYETVKNDEETTLNKVEVEHPVPKMMIEIAEAMYNKGKFRYSLRRVR